MFQCFNAAAVAAHDLYKCFNVSMLLLRLPMTIKRFQCFNAIAAAAHGHKNVSMFQCFNASITSIAARPNEYLYYY